MPSILDMFYEGLPEATNATFIINLYVFISIYPARAPIFHNQNQAPQQF